MFPQYGELQPTGRDRSGSFGAPLQISTGFASSWQRYRTALQYWALAKLCAALNRGHHLYSAGRPSRWALGPHSIVQTIMWANAQRDGRPTNAAKFD